MRLNHHITPFFAAAALVSLAACSTPSASSPAEPTTAAATATATATVTTPATATATASAAAPEAASAAAPEAASAAAPEAAAASASASAPAPEAPLPAVKVANIGMHIGGGPNDAPTKAPIRKSVEPHFDEFRRCFALAEDQTKGGDVSIDLRIDRAGGKPTQVKPPKTSIKGADFKECVVHTFEAIEFLKPKGGTTVVSYSLRFTPSP